MPEVVVIASLIAAIVFAAAVAFGRRRAPCAVRNRLSD